VSFALTFQNELMDQEWAPELLSDVDAKLEFVHIPATEKDTLEKVRHESLRRILERRRLPFFYWCLRCADRCPNARRCTRGVLSGRGQQHMLQSTSPSHFPHHLCPQAGAAR